MGTICRTPKGNQRVATDQPQISKNGNKKKKRADNQATRPGFIHRD